MKKGMNCLNRHQVLIAYDTLDKQYPCLDTQIRMRDVEKRNALVHYKKLSLRRARAHTCKKVERGEGDI